MYLTRPCSDLGKSSESVQCAMACDACADMGQLQRTVPIGKTYRDLMDMLQHLINCRFIIIIKVKIMPTMTTNGVSNRSIINNFNTPKTQNLYNKITTATTVTCINVLLMLQCE